MTDAPQDGAPPEKRERGPGGTGTAHLENGNWNHTDSNTAKAAAKPPIAVPKERRRYLDNIYRIYPQLFPEGEIVDDGHKLRVGDFEIDLKGDNPGRWVNLSTGHGGDALFDLAEATGKRWVELSRRSGEIMAKIIAEESPVVEGHPQRHPATPNGVDSSRAPAQNPLRALNGHDREPVFAVERVAGRPAANGSAALHDDEAEKRRQEEEEAERREYLPHWRGKRSNAADPEVIAPPRTCDEILAYIKKIDRFASPADQISAISTALADIARARLDGVSEKQCLVAIKTQTKTMDLESLRKTLRQIKAEMGAAIRPTGNAAVTELCRRYVHVMNLAALWDRQMRAVVKIDGVCQAHWADMPPDDEGKPADPYDVMLKGIFGPPVDRVDKISFMPGSPEIFDEDGAVALNIWTPPDIFAVPGDPSPFLDHVAYILDGDAVAIDYLLNYLAHLVQKPWRKIKGAILIIGEPGIGKSLIGVFLSRLLGQRNTTFIEESNLTSTFNEWMDGVQLVIVEELMTLDRQGSMNRLKFYITGDRIRINPKNIPPYEYPNRANFLMFSNHEDAAKIEVGDRRYFVWISRAKKREDAYYKGLFDWFENGGAEALLHFLQTRDISGFNPDAAPPPTASKQRVIGHSRNATEAYLQAAFDAGDPPFQYELVVINDLIDFLEKQKNLKVTHKALSKFLRQVGADDLGQKRIENNIRRPNVWALRDAERWKNVDEGVVAQFYRRPSMDPPTEKERKERKQGIKAALNRANPATEPEPSQA